MTAPIKRLRSPFPCCDVACRHELEEGIARDVACPHCGRPYRVLLVRFARYAERMAGRPVGRVRFTPLEAEVRA